MLYFLVGAHLCILGGRIVVLHGRTQTCPTIVTILDKVLYKYFIIKIFYPCFLIVGVRASSEASCHHKKHSKKDFKK